MLLFLLLGCQSLDEEDVYHEVIRVGDEATTYEAQALMRILTGDGEEEIALTIRRKDDLYQVQLIDGLRGLDQTLVRNKEGVYLLTDNEAPELFRMDWPNDRPQLYLLTAIVDTLRTHPEAAFEEIDGGYQFSVNAPLREDPDLSQQEIIFDKKTYLPRTILVTNVDETKQIMIEFQSINVTPDFKEEIFDVELDDTRDEVDLEDEQESPHEGTVGWYYPTETFNQRLTQTEEKEVNGKNVVMMTYSGDKPFTFIQTKRGQTTSNEGVLTVIKNDDTFTLDASGWVWSNPSTDFYVASDHLTIEEKETIATSVEWIADK
ncbi:LolA family protein [Halolactibacillus alkaliphilus]|uniref:LolA family protein n=1 Tax=Halolactibacillus alkaliphilus TaxID=442899 RepID=UPI0008E5B556|nr:hypothetical protein [Halolactibacillus alkaliphilus]SFO75936.1 Outer membrane lipoprotein-sorting protein [Halolactibacillus alkaliphilus]